MASLEEIPTTILDIVADCYQAYEIALQNPDEFDSYVMGIQLHWQPIIHLILDSDLQAVDDLLPLNDMFSCLSLEADEYAQVFSDQLTDLYQACENYELFEPHWAEMEPILSSYLEQFQNNEVQPEESMVVG
jgi:hypothetical protein